MIAASTLVSCNIDYTDMFGSGNDNPGGGDQTPAITQTDVSGLAVARSDSNVDTTFNRLRNNLDSSQGLQTSAVDFVNSADAAGTGGTTTGAGGTPSSGSGSGSGSGGTAGSGAGAGGNTSPGTGAGAGGNAGPGTGAGAGGNNGPGTGAGAGGNARPGTGAGATTGSGTGAGAGNNGQQNGLRPTRLLLFDNPNRITPILRADPRAALDLPGILVYRDSNGDVGVAYDTVDYLRARYRLADADRALNALADDLRTLAQSAAGNGVSRANAAGDIGTGAGIVRRRSDNNFANTVDRLASAIDNQVGITRIASFDNRALATTTGSDLNPSTLFVFEDIGDDRALLLANQTVGIDLPQRMLVTDNGGQVNVYYNDPAFIARRHNITGRGDAIDAIQNSLSDLADRATSTTSSNTNGSNASGS